MKIETGRNAISLPQLAAIYSVSMVTSLPGLAVSPILGKLETVFGHASDLQLQMLESLPSFVIVPFILLAGRLSLRFDTKRLLIAGLGVFFACSLTYPFANRMWMLLAISGLLGVGAGLVVPFSTGLVADYFHGRRRTKQLGIVSAISNLTLVVATFAAGRLAGIDWHLSFAVYCLSGISLFFAFFLDKKPPRAIGHSSTSAPSPHPASSLLRKYGWLLKLMFFYYLITLLALIVPLNLSLYLHDLKIGNYDTSGTIISVFFLSMTVPGLFVNRILSLLQSFANTAALFLVCIGLLLFACKADTGWLAAGVISVGFGYGVMQPLVYDRTASLADPAKTTFALSWVMVMNYVAIITCPFLLQGFQSLFSIRSAAFPFLLGCVASGIAAIFSLPHHNANRSESTLGRQPY